MYRSLDAARRADRSPEVQARIDDLILWTHYVERYRHYQARSGALRQSAFEDLIRFAYRIGKTHMVAARPMYYYYNGGMDPQVKISDAAEFHIEEEKNPWKDSQPFSRQEIDKLLSDGIASHPTSDIEPVDFSEDLVPVTPLGFKKAVRNRMWISRGVRTLYTWVEKDRNSVKIRVRAGCLPQYRDRGPAKVRLFYPAHSQTMIDNALAQQTGEWTDVTLATEHAGLHRIEVHDRNYNEVEPEPGTPSVEKWTQKIRPDDPTGSFWGYFFVPTGTDIVAGYAPDGYTGRILGSDGKVLLDFNSGPPRYFKIKVPNGQGGRAWKFDGCGSTPFLLTVPPYIARSPDELLVPREVLAKEHQRRGK